MYRVYTELDSQAYDQFKIEWPGEIDFYSRLAEQAKARGEAVLEMACGSGRITCRLAQLGVRVTGADLSPSMLQIATRKSSDMPNVRWVQADLRGFDLGERYGLVIIAGHSFQFMLTPEEQVSCLESVHRHLLPGGTLAVHLDHQDFPWLGDITHLKAGVFDSASTFAHPISGSPVRQLLAWTYQPATQTAILKKVWEVSSESGEVIEHLEWEPMPMHCVFRFEMQHLLARVGFELEALYGDFLGSELKDDSTSMVWVAKKTR